MYFPSKKDIWLTIIFWLLASILIVLPVFFPEIGVWMTPDFLNKHWIKIVILTPIGFCLLWIWFKTGYTIEKNLIVIQYGPFRMKVKINEINSIRETKNPFTAPALSMDKLEINYAKFNTVSISPKNKEQFVQKLLEQNSNINFIMKYAKEKKE